MLDIRIPNDINRAVLYISVLILIAILVYNLTASSNSFIPKPLAFLWASVGGIFVSLCIWGYQNSIYNDFKRRFGYLPLEKWEFYRHCAPKMNSSAAVSVVFFFVFIVIAFFLQFT